MPEWIMGCGDRRLELALVIAGIIHMLVEWRLGKRAEQGRGSGSLLGLVLTALVAAVTLMVSWRKSAPKDSESKGD